MPWEGRGMLPEKPPPQPPELGSPCSPSEEEEEEEGAKKAKKKAPQGRKGRAETSSEASTSESSSSGSDSGSEAEAKQRKAVRAGMGWDVGCTGIPEPPIELPSLPHCSPPAARPAPRRFPCLTWMTVSGCLEYVNGHGGGGAGETEA